MRKTLLVAALLAIIPAVSQAKTLEDLLADNGLVANNGRAAAEEAKISWNDGTRVEFPDTGFSAGVNTLIRVGYGYINNDDAGNQSSFEVANARLTVSGHALNKEFTYLVKTELAGSSASLLDAWIAWNACDMASVKLGQFKAASGRGFNTDEGKLQFANRSLATDVFDLGRNQGVAVTGSFGKVDLGLQALNGGTIAVNNSGDIVASEGINSFGLDNDHTYIVSVRSNVMGEQDAFSEGDVGNTDDLAVNVGASAAFTDNNGFENRLYTADVNVKSSGLSVHAELFYGDNDSDAVNLANGVANLLGFSDVAGENPFGYYVQAGYFVMPKELEVAVRYSSVDSDAEGSDSVDEVEVSLNKYFWAHHLKAQLGAELSDDLGRDVYTLVVSGDF